MEEINKEEQVVVSNEANQNETAPENIEGEIKKPFKKRAPLPSLTQNKSIWILFILYYNQRSFAKNTMPLFNLNN